MKVLAFNGPRAGNTIFAIVCVCVIAYFGFLSGDVAVTVSSSNVSTAYLAVIIDDFGNGGDGVREFLYMDIPFTGAVMPSSSLSAEESRLLRENGKDILLHMPMEPVKGDRTWLPEYSIMSGATAEDAKELVSKSIEEIQGCVGINNHMGSKVMQSEELVRAVLETAKANNLIFIDSKTDNKGLARKIGAELGMTILENDVFLDSTKDVAKVEKNLLKAADLAAKNGYAIAIGHVGGAGGKTTAQAINNMKEEIQERNIEFVTISQLMEILGIAEE